MNLDWETVEAACLLSSSSYLIGQFALLNGPLQDPPVYYKITLTLYMVLGLGLFSFHVKKPLYLLLIALRLSYIQSHTRIGEISK